MASLATPIQIFDGAATVHIKPFTPIGYPSRVEALIKHLDVVELTDVQAVFALCDTITEGFELHDDTHVKAGYFARYWQSRNGSIAHNWDVAQEMFAADMIDAWFNAFEAARGNDGIATEQSDPDPKAGTTP